MEKILLVEDDRSQQEALATLLKTWGYEVLTAGDDGSASRLFGNVPDIILTDLNLGGGTGLEVLQEARQVLPETPVIITTGYGTIASAVKAMKDGAFDYLTKPINPEELLLAIQRPTERSQLQREIRRLRQQVEERGLHFGMVGNSAVMRHVFDQIQLVAQTNSTDLITGESGTGKELVARAIHQLSSRKDRPFIALNCAAIPKDLAESELFGHAKGAFTGATERHIGKFAAAHRGTLLIDEIGEMELPVQAKLVRTLETRTITPVGSNEEQRVDVRVVAATHRNLRLPDRCGQVPRRPLLPLARSPYRSAAVTASAGGHPTAGGVFPATIQPGEQPGGAGLPGCHGGLAKLLLARQRP